MEDINQVFHQAQVEFIYMNASEASVEKLYDISYDLEMRNRNFDENYVLAQIYNILGKRISASKIIEFTLKEANSEQKHQLNKLVDDMSYKERFIINIYRDLREAKLIKSPSKLTVDDFVIQNTEIGGWADIKISDEFANIVILNKNLNTHDDVAIAVPHFSANQYFEQLIDYIEWLGDFKNDLLTFYTNNSFELKYFDVDQNWFDGLDVDSLVIEIDNKRNVFCEIVIYDYLKNNMGFRLEIENRIIKSIEYDPIL